MSWRLYGDYDSGQAPWRLPPWQRSAFLQMQHMQQLGWGASRAPQETNLALHTHFPGHKQGMAPFACPPRVCPNAKCKAVNNTGKPKLLECRLCAEPRPLATTLWALEDYGGPGLAEAKRMMAKGSRVKGAGKGAPGAPPVSQASKGASKGDNPKGKGKGDHKPPQKPPATPATPQVSKEALAILKETGHDTNKKATEDSTVQEQDQDMGQDQDDVWEEDPRVAQEQQVEELRAYMAELDERGDPYNLVKHLKTQLQEAQQKLAKLEEKAQKDKAKRGPKTPDKVSVLAAKQAELAKQVALTLKQKEAAEADFDNRLRQKAAQQEKLEKEFSELTAQRRDKVSQLEELLVALEQSTAVLEREVRARVPHRAMDSGEDDQDSSDTGAWTDPQGVQWRAARQARSTTGKKVRTTTQARQEKRNKRLRRKEYETATLQVSQQGFELMFGFFEKALKEGAPKDQLQKRWEAEMMAGDISQPRQASDGDSEGEEQEPTDPGTVGDQLLKRKKSKFAEYERKAEQAKVKMWRQQRANQLAKKQADTVGLRDMGDSHADAPMEDRVGSPPPSPFQPTDSSGQDF
jgi:hypothetical protein